MLLQNAFCVGLYLISLYSIDWVVSGMTILFYYGTTILRSLAAKLFLLLHLLTLRSGLILHIDRVVGLATVALLTKFVLTTHAVKLLILRAVLILHVLPSFDIAIHLLHPSRLNTLLSY